MRRHTESASESEPTEPRALEPSPEPSARRDRSAPPSIDSEQALPKGANSRRSVLLWLGGGPSSSLVAFDTDFLAGFDGNPDQRRGRRPLHRCKPGVSPGRPLSTSQNFPSRAWEKADFRQNPPETALFAVGPSPDGGWNASGRGRRRRGSRQRGPTRAGRRRKQDRKGSVLQQNRTERGGRKTRRREKESAPPNGEPGRKSVTTRRPVPQPSIHWPSSEGEKRARPRMRYTRSIDRTRPR